MQDIKYYMKSYSLKKRVLDGKVRADENLAEQFEAMRSEKPTVFQIETTNICNLKCVMCPRTTKMTRKLGTMSPESYKKIVDQIEMPTATEKLKWKHFINVGQFKTEFLTTDEDFFNFVISADVLTLHGFGEPLLDQHLVERIKVATEKAIPTYFSCNPSNMKDSVFQELLDAGVGYVKFSIDGLDDETLRKYRGKENLYIEQIEKRFQTSAETIKAGNYKTVLVLTMIQFGGNVEQNDEFLDKWKDADAFPYIKNSHNRWLYEEGQTPENTSHYMRSFCEYPWMSLSVLWDGTVVPCPIDYNGTLNMGNTNTQSLYEIWNSEKYRRFRAMHADGSIPKEHYCRAQCDMPILSDTAEARRKEFESRVVNKEQREQAILDYKKQAEKAVVHAKSAE